MKWNKCFVVQYGNIQYTNIVVKNIIFCLLKVATVGGRLRLRPPKQNFFWGDASPHPPIIAAHVFNTAFNVTTLHCFDFSNLRSFKHELNSSFLARHSAVYYF